MDLQRYKINKGFYPFAEDSVNEHIYKVVKIQLYYHNSTLNSGNSKWTWNQANTNKFIYCCWITSWVALFRNTNFKIILLFYPVPILSKQGKVNIPNGSDTWSFNNGWFYLWNSRFQVFFKRFQTRCQDDFHTVLTNTAQTPDFPSKF